MGIARSVNSEIFTYTKICRLCFVKKAFMSNMVTMLGYTEDTNNMGEGVEQ